MYLWEPTNQAAASAEEGGEHTVFYGWFCLKKTIGTQSKYAFSILYGVFFWLKNKNIITELFPVVLIVIHLRFAFDNFAICWLGGYPSGESIGMKLIESFYLQIRIVS